MKNKLLSFGMLLTLTIATISPAKAISLASLRNSLSKVCISDASTCGTVFEGIYNTISKTCSCYSSILSYNPSTRKCEVSCQPGYYLKTNYTCPPGSYKIEIKRRRLYSYERG